MQHIIGFAKTDNVKQERHQLLHFAGSKAKFAQPGGEQILCFLR